MERISGGSRNMRYSYNPMTEYRKDTYSYTDFNIRIGGYYAFFELSKANLAYKHGTDVKSYCSITNEFNANSRLLQLLQTVSDDEKAVQRLKKDYGKTDEAIICRVE